MCLNFQHKIIFFVPVSLAWEVWSLVRASRFIPTSHARDWKSKTTWRRSASTGLPGYVRVVTARPYEYSIFFNNRPISIY